MFLTLLNSMHKTIYQASRTTIQRKRTLYNPTLLSLSVSRPQLLSRSSATMKFSKVTFCTISDCYVNYQTHDCSINGLDHTTIQAYNCQMQSLAQQSFVSLGLSQSLANPRCHLEPMHHGHGNVHTPMFSVSVACCSCNGQRKCAGSKAQS